MKKPTHCKGCVKYRRAGHPEGTSLHGSRYDNWCGKYSASATAAVGNCKNKNGKEISK